MAGMGGPIKPPTSWEELKNMTNGIMAIPRGMYASMQDIGRAANEIVQPNPDPYIVGKGAFEAGLGAIGLGTIFGVAPLPMPRVDDLGRESE